MKSCSRGFLDIRSYGPLVKRFFLEYADAQANLLFILLVLHKLAIYQVGLHEGEGCYSFRPIRLLNEVLGFLAGGLI